MPSKKGGSYRSAVSGRYVTTKHGRSSPRTTLYETKGAKPVGGRHRSAISGKFVTGKYGRSNPRTTIEDN